MNGFTLAAEFLKFVAREWPGKAEERSDLYEFFEDWAREIDLFARTAGDYTMALQTWTITAAWFAQRPEDFSAIREFVTVPLDLPPEATSLRGMLDQGEWNYQVFRRKYGNPQQMTAY